MQITGYSIFLMVELAREAGIIDRAKDVGLTWNEGIELAEEYNKSEFSNSGGVEESIEKFLDSKDWINIDVQQPQQGHTILYQGNHGSSIKATYIAENVVRKMDGFGVALFQFWQPNDDEKRIKRGLKKLLERYHTGDLRNQKLKLVKEIKTLTGWGLKVSKEYMDNNI